MKHIKLDQISILEEVSANVDITLGEALLLMNRNHVGTVVLLNDDETPYGIITESNIVQNTEIIDELYAPAVKYATFPIIATNKHKSAEYALNKMLDRNIRRLVITNDDNTFFGLIIQDKVVKYLEEEVYKISLRIKHIIEEHKEFITINKELSIAQTLKIFKTHQIGCVFVEEEQEIIGVLTERDLLKPVIKRAPVDTPIKEFMSTPVVSCQTEDLVTDIIDIMDLQNIRHILVRDMDGNPQNVITNRDIMLKIKGNYNRMLEMKLKHAKDVLNIIPEALVEIYESSNDYIIQWMNKKAINVFGLSFIDKPVEELLTPATVSRLKSLFQKSDKINLENIVIDNTTYEISGSQAQSFDDRVIKLIFKDVTVHKSMQQELQQQVNEEILKRMEKEHLLMQQSKLASMGEMIGNIAHQWRQPLSQLSGMVMNLQALKKLDRLTDDTYFEKLDEADNLIKYMSETINDFQTFFSTQNIIKDFQVHSAIKRSLEIIDAALVYHNITLNINSDKTLYITGNQNEFSQMVLNILANAKDVLVAKNIERGEISIDIYEEEGFSICKIEDNGGGIPTEPIEKIFEPYFTTKEKDGGSGIGLYMCKIIIEKMGGTLEVTNSHKGAVFYIKVPTSI